MLEAVAAAARRPRARPCAGRSCCRAACPRPPGSPSPGGVAALEAVAPEVGRPVRPMLASPAENLDAALAELGRT